jgi:hypothetical protein
MKFILKFIAIFTASVILLAACLFSASLLLQNKVAGRILKSFNNDIQTKFEFGSARLSFLRNFPKASIELSNVTVHSSHGFNSGSFKNINTDTLLYAKSVSAAFSITDIIHGVYNIDRLSVKDGRLNVYTDASGNVNYDISNDTLNDGSAGSLTINLEKINVSRVSALYNNLATKLIIRGVFENGKMNSLIAGDDIDFTASSDIRIERFSLFDFTIRRNLGSKIDISLHSSPKGILIRKGNMKVDGINLGISGFISEDDNIDLLVKGENIDLSGIKKYLPDSLNKKLSEYNPSGILNIKGTLKGPLARTRNPRIDILFDIAKGHVSYLNSSLNIDNLSFNGSFSNGAKMIPATSSLSLESISCNLGTAHYSGSFLIQDFDSLCAQLHVEGKIIPAEIKEFFRLKEISDAGGSADMDLTLCSRIPDFKHFTVFDFLALKPAINLEFHSFAAGINRNRIKVADVNGNLGISDTVFARNLSFRWRGSSFRVNGSFIELAPWLAGKPVVLRVNANVSADEVDALELFPSLADTTAATTAYMLPRDIVLDLGLKINKFKYKTFSAEKITSTLNYKPGILNFKSLDLNSMQGSISGNGFILQNRNKSFMSKGNFELEKIDINESFRVFHNFGQDFIKAENLAGRLSGNVSLLLPEDSLLNPVLRSLSAEGKYIITDGALVDFKPIQELSSFIELSELKNIHFQTLENDFFIRNNFVFTPLMDVKSSAANLSVSGKQSLDNDYEYHVRILLSEMLSRKIRKPKPNTTEFGAVKDDGLGRTSVLLKIVSKGDDFKVSYDIKAAGSQIKNDIKNERQNLKTILNQEYGWFRKDTASAPAPKASAPRFKIAWGDADTVKVEQEETPTKDTQSPLRNLFRKK